LNFPVLFSLASLLVLWLATKIGVSLRARRPLKDDEHADFGVVQSAALTLLALLIGFSFSMAIGRYDLRKTYEESEAKAIGTEHARAGLLPAAQTAVVRAQLKKYTACEFRSTEPARRPSFTKSIRIPLNCSRRCGQLLKQRPYRNRHLWSPSPWRA
jgi:hypothetical protein